MTHGPRLARGVLALSLCVAGLRLAGAASAESWVAWKAPEGGVQLFVPVGWAVGQQGAMIELKRDLTGEQALVIVTTLEQDTSARAFAETIFAEIRKAYGDLAVSNWGESDAKDLASCEVAYTDAGLPYRGLCVSRAVGRNMAWITATSPAAAFAGAPAADERTKALVTTLSESLAPTLAGKPQAEEQGNLTYHSLPQSRLEADGRAFAFVLEFAMTAPLTSAQEDAILTELLGGWKRLPAADMAQFDAYPEVARRILGAADRAAVDAFRANLERAIRDWLAGAPADDPAVKALHDQLARKGKVLLQGEPPLTEMAADAYAEFYAYSRLLATRPEAAPEEVAREEVAAVRKQLTEAWKSFDKPQREQVASAPGLWIAVRGGLSYGKDADRQSLRKQIATISAQPGGGDGANAGDTGTASGDNAVKRAIRSNIMLDMQRDTFNTWQWSMGYKQTPFGW